MKLTPSATSASYTSPTDRKALCSSSLFGMRALATGLADAQTLLNALAGHLRSSIEKELF
jgi:hypothetical protein